jgi:hypothetical protein
VAAHPPTAVGRHERRPHLVEVSGHHPQPTPRATRASKVHTGGDGRAATRASKVHTDGDGRAATRASKVRTGGARPGHLQAAGGALATRAGRSRHAARPGWVVWAGRARRVARQVREWWAEGAERVAARARDRWVEQVAAARARARWADPATLRQAAPAAPRLSDPAGPRHLAATSRTRQAQAGWREDLVTGWCSLLLVAGLYVDGAAGSSLSPGRGVLVVGLAATAGWILTRGQRRGAWSLRAVPPGYRLGLVGLGLGMVAVAGDGVWHALVGEAQGPGRLVAPFHLVLLAGACLLVGLPLRAAWSGPGSARVPSLRPFWPVVLSATLVVAAAAWFFQDVSPIAAPPAGSPFAGTPQVDGLLGLLAHNLLFIAPVLFLLLRWQPPLGTFTVVGGSVALLLATQTGLGLVGLAGAAVLGGAAADVAVSLLRPSPQRRWAARAVAVVAPAVYWTSHFALLTAGYGVTFQPEIWLGSVVWASLSGLSLAVAIWPPAVPLTAWNRGRAGPARSSSARPTPVPARMVGR